MTSSLGNRRVEEAANGDEYVVVTIAAHRALSTYRCPGCDHTIVPGTAHIVAWPPNNADDRRHWHRPCWEARERRGLSRRWS